MSADLITLAVVGCGSAKLPRRAPARELYTSALFRLSLARAEAVASSTRVLSAEHGLVAPDVELEPYETRAPRWVPYDKRNGYNRAGARAFAERLHVDASVASLVEARRADGEAAPPDDEFLERQLARVAARTGRATARQKAVAAGQRAIRWGGAA